MYPESFTIRWRDGFKMALQALKVSENSVKEKVIYMRIYDWCKEEEEKYKENPATFRYSYLVNYGAISFKFGM